MEAISARMDGDGGRVSLPFVNQFLYPHTGAYPQHTRSGAPWVVVEDGSDRPVKAKPGHVWVIQVDPGERNYGDAIEVPVNSNARGVAAALDYRQRYNMLIGTIEPISED